MKDLLAGIGAWEPRAKIALIVLIIAVASTAGVLTYSIISSDHPEPQLVRGDLTVRGSIAQEGVEADEYAGVATLTYELSGSDIEWRILDLDDTVFVRDIGGGYSERGYTTASNGRMLTIDEPGRYSVRLYVDGDLDRSGTAILDGPVDRTFSWMQTLASGASHSYSVSVRYMYSDYLDYHQDDAVRHQNQDSDARFVVIDDTVRMLESALEAEFREVRGSAAAIGGQDYADYLLSFVQSCISYPDPITSADGGYVLDAEEGSGDMFLHGEWERWSYPLETIHTGYGDCEDTTFLAASLFSAAGYGTAIATIPNHMVVAVVLGDFTPHSAVTGLELAEKRVTSTGENLFFCETATDVAVPCGYVTKEVLDGIDALDSVTMVVP